MEVNEKDCIALIFLKNDINFKKNIFLKPNVFVM